MDIEEGYRTKMVNTIFVTPPQYTRSALVGAHVQLKDGGRELER